MPAGVRKKRKGGGECPRICMSVSFQNLGRAAKKKKRRGGKSVPTSPKGTTGETLPLGIPAVRPEKKGEKKKGGKKGGHDDSYGFQARELIFFIGPCAGWGGGKERKKKKKERKRIMTASANWSLDGNILFPLSTISSGRKGRGGEKKKGGGGHFPPRAEPTLLSHPLGLGTPHAGP